MTMAAAEQGLDLAALVREHQAGLWRYLRALGAEPFLADDLAQEVFLAALRSGFVQRSRGETIRWLRTTGRNQYLKARQKQGREISTAQLETLDRRWQELDRDGDGETAVTALRRCLEQLDDKPRQALALQYTHGLAREQVAQKLGMTDDGVKTLLARTKARLKKCMELRVREG